MSFSKYYTKIFASPRFWKHPFSTSARVISLLGLILFKKDRVISLPFGSANFKFNYRHGERHQGGRGIYIYRRNIEELMLFGDRFLKIGATCIDGGANQGIYTLAFASYVGSTGKVVSVEPMPYACKYIKENVSLNNFNNVVVSENALSNEVGTATLDYSTGVGSASIFKEFGGSNTQDVKTTTIDELFREHDLKTVDFIKLDIEGAKHVLDTYAPIVCLEVSDVEDAENEGSAHFAMIRRGYSPYVFNGSELVPAEPFIPPYMNVFYIQ